jgi:hypothetical protein
MGLLRDSFSFLITKDKTHVSMLGLPYVFQLPGLVHFIHVDRSKNRVYAPAITPLHGQESGMSEADSESMAVRLQRHVWYLVSQAQVYLSQGFCCMMLRTDHYLYCWKLWVEEEGGAEVALEKPFASAVATLQCGTGPFYEALLRTCCPGQKGLRCLELYSLFIGVVPSEAAANANTILSGAIRKSLIS